MLIKCEFSSAEPQEQHIKLILAVWLFYNVKDDVSSRFCAWFAINKNRLQLFGVVFCYKAQIPFFASHQENIKMVSVFVTAISLGLILSLLSTRTSYEPACSQGTGYGLFNNTYEPWFRILDHEPGV